MTCAPGGRHVGGVGVAQLVWHDTPGDPVPGGGPGEHRPGLLGQQLLPDGCQGRGDDVTHGAVR